MTTTTLQNQAQAMIAKQKRLAESLKGILKQYSADLDAMNKEFLAGLSKLRHNKIADIESASRKAEDPEAILSKVTKQ